MLHEYLVGANRQTGGARLTQARLQAGLLFYAGVKEVNKKNNGKQEQFLHLAFFTYKSKNLPTRPMNANQGSGLNE